MTTTVEPQPKTLEPEPMLTFDEFGVALHFVARTGTKPPTTLSPAFASFEEDLFSYSYVAGRRAEGSTPFASALVTTQSAPTTVSLTLPEMIVYTSEGR